MNRIRRGHGSPKSCQISCRDPNMPYINLFSGVLDSIRKEEEECIIEWGITEEVGLQFVAC